MSVRSYKQFESQTLRNRDTLIFFRKYTFLFECDHSLNQLVVVANAFDKYACMQAE